MGHINPNVGIMTNYGLLAMDLIPPRKLFSTVGVRERERKRERRGQNQSRQKVE